MKERLGNIPYIIGYILGILFVLTAAVFYRQPLLSVLFILLVIMAPLSIYFTGLAVKRLTLTLSSPYAEYGLPTEIRLSLWIDNPMPLPLLNCRLYYSLYNLYYPKTGRDELLFAAEARTHRELILPLKVSAAGLIRFVPDGLYISDLLHLHTWELRPDIRLDIPVYPEERRLHGYKLHKSEAEAEDVEWAASGEPTRDIRQIREYRPGDRLKDIHWKLAAGTEDIPVKEYEQGRELYYLLLPDPDTDTLQETLKTFYNLAGELLKAGEVYRVAMYHMTDDSIELIRVGSPDDLKAVMLKLYREQIPEPYGSMSTSPAHNRLLSLDMRLTGVIRISGTEITEN